MTASMATNERHPLAPFTPDGATLLMLGSFPPPRARWSMDFFYPNWINDMWRIVGLLFFDDRKYFEVSEEKRFDKERIALFCSTKGLALYDAATEVRRLKENASDKFLEVAEPTDLKALLERLPHCRAIVTTGQKATDLVVAQAGCAEPSIGGYVEATIGDRTVRIWRMPSTSRAYPLSLEKKAAYYRPLFEAELR